MIRGDLWLMVHTLRRWIVQMQREGPEAAPTAALRALFSERHASRLQWAKDQIERMAQQ